MNISKTVVAGTLESSDIMITLEPMAEGIDVDLTSTVEKQFGDIIRLEISNTLQTLGVSGVKVVAVDKGALDCTIRARVKTAVYRAAGGGEQP